MKKRHLQIVVSLAICLSSFANTVLSQVSAPTEKLSGRIVIRANGAPPPPIKTRIWVYEAQGQRQYVVQEEKNGDFSISLPEGYYFVFVANLGLIPYAKAIWLEHGKPVKLNVYLDPDVDIMQDTTTVK